MKKDFNQQSMDKQRCNIVGALRCVKQQIAELAPHPDQTGKGPVFVSSSQGPASGEQDGMLGSLLLDCVTGGLLGTAFCETLGLSADIAGHWNELLEVTDEFWMDRRNANDNTGYELGRGGAMAGSFNRQSRPLTANQVWDIKMDAFLADRTQRQKLEGAYATMGRQYAALRP